MRGVCVERIAPHRVIVWDHNSIRIVEAGIVSLLAGGDYRSGSGIDLGDRFTNPTGCVLNTDSSTLYFCDQNLCALLGADMKSKIVKRLAPRLKPQQMWNRSRPPLYGCSGHCDGDPLTNARFTRPNGLLLLEHERCLILADSGNSNRIRRVPLPDDIFSHPLRP